MKEQSIKKFFSQKNSGCKTCGSKKSFGKPSNIKSANKTMKKAGRGR